MVSPMHCWSPQKLLTMLLFLLMSFSLPSSANLSKKLDQPMVPQPAETEIKCGACPCVNPCGQQLLPPPPPSPPSPPPSPPNNPATQYCAPPPPSTPPPPRFIYVTGVPGYMYGTEPYNNWVYYSGAGRNVMVGLLLLLGCAVLELIVI